MYKKIETIAFPKPIDLNTQFVLANMDTFGFYRVNYDESNWQKIINQLKVNKNVSSTF